MLRPEQVLQQRNSTNIVNPRRRRHRERVFRRGSLERFGESADFGAFGEGVGVGLHFDGEFEDGACVHVGRRRRRRVGFGGLFQFGVGDEGVPVAVVGEVEEGIVDCGGWRVDDGLAHDGEGW